MFAQRFGHRRGIFGRVFGRILRDFFGDFPGRLAMLLALVGALATGGVAQTTHADGSLRGKVTDPSGAVVAGAAVSAAASGGEVQHGVSDKVGNYNLHGLPEGNVTVTATAPGFAKFELPFVIIRAGETQQLDIPLSIGVEKQQITVESETQGTTVEVNPENNASAVILKGEDLEALPDDPDELQADLLALAGPSVGPNGGQIYIDGFSDATLPPKSSIREIRINQNPFSAEYDKPGYGRIEIFTKPGTNVWHGQAEFNENNSVFNSRNPYLGPEAPSPPYHSEIYEGNVSGALSKKASIFLNVQHRNIHNLDVVAASAAADSDLPLDQQAVPAPQSRTNVSGRLDYQLTTNNTLTARYQFLDNSQDNQGIGGLTLPQAGYNSDQTTHTLQVTDTQIINSHIINETHFQYIHDESSDIALTPGVAAIDVGGVFNAGGSTFGESTDTINRFELQNYTSWAAGKHFVKFGGRLRAYHDDSDANSNFNGTFTYSTLTDYLNGTPAQYQVVTGNPRFELAFADVGVYGEDDWKLRPNLTLSYGLRFESQSTIHDKTDFAPRVGLSWGLGKAKSAPKTVLRLGWGIFYDRFSEELIEQAERENGIIETEEIYSSKTGPIVCTAGAIPPLPASPSCSMLPTLNTTFYRIQPTLHAPYTLQSAVSLEQQIGKIGTISFTYLNSLGRRQLITENINAPLDPSAPLPDSTRPLSAQYGDDNIYQYTSEALFNQNQFITNVTIRLTGRLSLIGYYAVNFANSDTGGPGSNPSNQYNLHQDYGRASFDIRHRIFLSGSASLPHNIRVSPFVLINSGAPFNITTGEDNNDDSFFNDRPAFAPAGSAGSITTPYGTFNPTPAPGEKPIPVNYGNGFANVTVNMRVSKSFGFGKETKKTGEGAEPGGGGGGHGGGGHGGGLGAPHGIGAFFAPPSTTKRYNLTLTMTARNIFNTWNPGAPIGNLSSPNFGKTVSLAGGPFSNATANRRVDFQALFSF